MGVKIFKKIADKVLKTKAKKIVNKSNLSADQKANLYKTVSNQIDPITTKFNKTANAQAIAALALGGGVVAAPLLAGAGGGAAAAGGATAAGTAGAGGAAAGSGIGAAEIGQGVAGLAGVGSSIAQKRKAKRLQQQGQDLQSQAYSDLTPYQIPVELQANYQNAQNEAYGKPAVQQYLENAANQNQANNISAVKRYATSGADALAAISGVNNQNQQDMTQAAITGAQVHQQNLGNLYQTGNALADYKSMAWDMNVNMPFQQRLQFSQDLIGAGYQGQLDANNNMLNSFSQVGQAAVNYGSARRMNRQNAPVSTYSSIAE